MDISRRLAVRRDKVEEIKQAVKRKGYPNQQELADAIEISRSTLSPFLNGKSVSIDSFQTICKGLGLNWKEIADFDHDSEQDADELDLSDPTTWFPEGLIAPNSPFYMERPGIESLCQNTVKRPGSLLRIKAPRFMGKTSLLQKIEAYAKGIGYRTVHLDLASENRSTFNDVDDFLQWFCRKVGKKLRVEKQIKDFWETELGSSNEKCTDYFDNYILAISKAPLILALDNVERLFPYQELADDFFGLLRGWYEGWKSDDTFVWQRLRLILTYSTEEYVPLNINDSPFNVGVAVELEEFDSQQVKELVERRKVVLTEVEIQNLMDMIGGHPYLVQLALYNIANKEMPLDSLLEKAPTAEGIYERHLWRLLNTLEQASELAQVLKKVVSSNRPVELPSKQIYTLHSLGVVKKQGNSVEPRCKLYREYFCREL